MRNITGEYVEWLRPELKYAYGQHINGYSSRHAMVISVSFGMQAQLE